MKVSIAEEELGTIFEENTTVNLKLSKKNKYFAIYINIVICI